MALRLAIEKPSQFIRIIYYCIKTNNDWIHFDLRAPQSVKNEVAVGFKPTFIPITATGQTMILSAPMPMLK